MAVFMGKTYRRQGNGYNEPCKMIREGKARGSHYDIGDYPMNSWSGNFRPRKSKSNKQISSQIRRAIEHREMDYEEYYE